MKKLNLKKYYSLILTLIFFITSCTSSINNTVKVNKSFDINLNEYNLVSASEARDLSTYIYKSKTPFNIKNEGGVACRDKGIVLVSGTLPDPQDCTVTVEFKEDGNTIKSLINPSLGYHYATFGCSCGVTRFAQIVTNKQGGSACDSVNLSTGASGNLFNPCTNEDRPEEEQEPECEGDSPVIEPSALKSTFNIKAYTSSDIQSSVEEYLSKVNEVNMLQSQYDNLDNRGLNSKRDEIYTKLQNSITQRNSIKTDLITGLTNYKNSLRSKVNSLMNDPDFSVDSNYQPTDLQDYKDEIYYFENNLESLSSLGNTYNLIEFKSLLADKIKLLIDLINEYSTGISDSSLISNPFDELDTLNKAEQVIIYHSKNIDKYKLKFETEITKLDKSISTLNFIKKDLIEVDQRNEALLSNLQNEITKRENGIFELPSFSIKSLHFSIKQTTRDEWQKEISPLLDEHEKLAEDRVNLINDIVNAVNNLSGTSIPTLRTMYDRLSELSEKNKALQNRIQKKANKLCHPCLINNLTGEVKIPKYLPKIFGKTPREYQQQAGHVYNTPQFKNRIYTKKDTGYFANWTDAINYSLDTWNNGTTILNNDQKEIKELTYPNGVGYGTSGTPVAKVRVEMNKATGTIHGYPKG